MNHTIFLGGTIITCGTEANTCEALVIENGKILATGSKQDILNDYGNGATIRDLRNEWIDFQRRVFFHSEIIMCMLSVCCAKSAVGRHAAKANNRYSLFILDRKSVV